MEITINPQLVFDAIGMGIHSGLSIVWTIIDTIVFIELNNPAAEIAIFVGLITVIFSAYKLIPWLIRHHLSNNW